MSVLTEDHKQLLALGQEVTQQLRQGKVNKRKLMEALPEVGEHPPLKPFSQMFAHDLPPEPTGWALASLPGLSEVSGGLMGLWAIAGDTGVGKTTLAIQLGLDYARQEGHSVLHYDYENGKTAIAYHIGKVLGREKAQKHTERWYYREAIESLEYDLAHIKPPALIIADSIQAIATDDDEYNSINRWLRVFERLARDGYVVLLTSEKSRGTYGRPVVNGFAGARIEFKAWFGVQLLQDRHDSSCVQLHVVKNRHRKWKGYVLDLKRDKRTDWWFNEENARGHEEEED